MNPLDKLNEIAARHVRLWRDSQDTNRTLEDHVLDAITEVLDANFERECVQAMRDMDADREAWMRKYLKAAEELRAMTQCRDDAVAAAHLIHENKP